MTNAPASFTVAATGNTLTYQWYKNGIALTNGGDFAGVTTSNLLVSPAQAADAATTLMAILWWSWILVAIVSRPPNASLTLLAPNNLVVAGK